MYISNIFLKQKYPGLHFVKTKSSGGLRDHISWYRPPLYNMLRYIIHPENRICRLTQCLKKSHNLSDWSSSNRCITYQLMMSLINHLRLHSPWQAGQRTLPLPRHFEHLKQKTKQTINIMFIDIDIQMVC